MENCTKYVIFYIKPSWLILMSKLTQRFVSTHTILLILMVIKLSVSILIEIWWLKDWDFMVTRQTWTWCDEFNGIMALWRVIWTKYIYYHVRQNYHFITCKVLKSSFPNLLNHYCPNLLVWKWKFHVRNFVGSLCLLFNALSNHLCYTLVWISRVWKIQVKSTIGLDSV